MDECNKSVLFAPSLLTAPVARSPPGMCPPPYSARNAAAAALRVDCSKDVGREVHFKSHNMLFKNFANNYNTVVGGYSDTLGDREKCRCNQLSL